MKRCIITIKTTWSMTQTVEQRKREEAGLSIEVLKRMAPDWDQISVRELLHLMAVSKVTLTRIDMYIKHGSTHEDDA